MCMCLRWTTTANWMKANEQDEVKLNGNARAAIEREREREIFIITIKYANYCDWRMMKTSDTAHHQRCVKCACVCAPAYARLLLLLLLLCAMRLYHPTQPQHLHTTICHTKESTSDEHVDGDENEDEQDQEHRHSFDNFVFYFFSFPLDAIISFLFKWCDTLFKNEENSDLMPFSHSFHRSHVIHSVCFNSCCLIYL